MCSYIECSYRERALYMNVCMYVCNSQGDNILCSFQNEAVRMFGNPIHMFGVDKRDIHADSRRAYTHTHTHTDQRAIFDNRKLAS